MKLAGIEIRTCCSGRTTDARFGCDSRFPVDFSGVEEVGLVDGYAFISANLDFLSIEFQLLQYLQGTRLHCGRICIVVAQSVPDFSG